MPSRDMTPLEKLSKQAANRGGEAIQPEPEARPYSLGEIQPRTMSEHLRDIEHEFRQFRDMATAAFKELGDRMSALERRVG